MVLWENGAFQVLRTTVEMSLLLALTLVVFIVKFSINFIFNFYVVILFIS